MFSSVWSGANTFVALTEHVDGLDGVKRAVSFVTPTSVVHRSQGDTQPSQPPTPAGRRWRSEIAYNMSPEKAICSPLVHDVWRPTRREYCNVIEVWLSC